jgi:hypothetical protein
MKINELVCPTCGLKCFTSHAYTRCDGCQTVFYASESGQCKPPNFTPTWTWPAPAQETERGR